MPDEPPGLPRQLAEATVGRSARAIGRAAGAAAAANAAGSATATRPQRNAAVLAATATPLSSMAHSIAAAEIGSAPAW